MGDFNWRKPEKRSRWAKTRKAAHDASKRRGKNRTAVIWRCKTLEMLLIATPANSAMAGRSRIK
jgi:hypothetical protein